MDISDDIASLKVLVLSLLMRIDVLEAENLALKTENAELKNRLNLNSKNSHKPPSTDGLKKKPAIPKEKGKKTGGQIGHKGNTLKMVANPDQIILHHASSCFCCSKTFTEDDVTQITQKRQVFDIPRPALEVTEHQIGTITCCGQKHMGVFPDDVKNSVQYGSKIKALSVLLNTDYRVPFDKIEQLFSDIYGCSFNESTAVSSNKTCFEELAPIEDTIKSEVLSSQVVHFDETGMRVETKLHWFHTSSTQLFTYLFVHAKRGEEALLSAASILKDFENYAVHDCWSSYFKFQNCSHFLCIAHIIRELENLKQQNSLWAVEMYDFLFELYKLSEKGTVIVPDKEIWLKKYLSICEKSDIEEPPPIKTGKRGRPKQTKGRSLYDRLLEYQEGVIAFAFNELIPFTNNLAERDIRCLKIKQKVATSFRKFKGAEQYARIQSFVSSLRKHNMNVFQNLVRVFQKQNITFSIG